MNGLNNPSDPGLLVVGVILRNRDGLKEVLVIRVRDVVRDLAYHDPLDHRRAVGRIDMWFLSIAPLTVRVGLELEEGVGLRDVGDVVCEAVSAGRDLGTDQDRPVIGAVSHFLSVVWQGKVITVVQRDIDTAFVATFEHLIEYHGDQTKRYVGDFVLSCSQQGKACNGRCNGMTIRPA